MNPGYLSAFCLLLIALLVWMGTLHNMIGRLGLRPRTFYLFLFLLFVTSGWYIPLGANAEISIGAFFLPMSLFLFLWGRQERDNRTYSFAAALLAGVTLFLLRYMLKLDPVLQVTGEVYLIAGVAVALTPLMSRQAEQCLLTMGLGLCFMEVLTQLLLYPSRHFITLGEFAFRDVLVFSLFIGLFLRAVLFHCMDVSISLVRKALVRRSR
jgi:hypothetical protein